ncbi:MAG: YkgJ family cysteine cluster protein [Kiritimatiellales bacterium]
MIEPIINPCAGCPVNCCRDLRKLKLSPSEYQRVYEPFRDQFDFERKGSLYELSMHKGLSCPHLGEMDRCTIYETRPAECRLFPHTVNQTYHAGPLVLFTYHGKSPVRAKRSSFLRTKRRGGWYARWRAKPTAPEKLFWFVTKGRSIAPSANSPGSSASKKSPASFAAERFQTPVVSLPNHWT